MDDLSVQIEPAIDEIVQEYGLKCVRFSLAAIDIDNSKYDQIDESQMELIARQRGYQGDRAGLDILGADWGRVQGVNVLNNLANNPGAGGVAAAGAGMGMGLGAAGAFGSIAQQVFSPVTPNMGQQPMQQQVQQPMMGGGRFAPKTTQPAQQTSEEDPMEVLAKLKKMLDAGLIEQAEYDQKKMEILSRM